ncbi:MAG: hypothetical protein ACLQBX_05265 [Candidatus Limnocylindrales bacterium]
MKHPRRGVHATLVTALLIALVATAVAPAAFAAVGTGTLTVTPATTPIASAGSTTLTLVGAALSGGTVLTLTPTSGSITGVVSGSLTTSATGTLNAVVTYDAVANTSGVPVTITFTASDLAGDTPIAVTGTVSVSSSPVVCSPSTSIVTGGTINCSFIPSNGQTFTGWTAVNFTPTSSTALFASFVAGAAGLTGMITATYSVSGVTQTPITESYTITAAAAASCPLGSICGNAGGRGHGARNLRFYPTTATTCALNAAQPSTGVTTYGFAILNTTGRNRLNITVALKDAAPNTTYAVYMDQSGTCSSAALFSVTTNGQGNGAGHGRLALGSSTTFYVTATSATTAYVTPEVTLYGKGRGVKAPGNKGNNGHGHVHGHGHGHGKD